MVHEITGDLFQLFKTVVSYIASIKKSKTQIWQIFARLNAKPRSSPFSDKITNPERNDKVLAIFSRSNKIEEELPQSQEEEGKKKTKKVTTK